MTIQGLLYRVSIGRQRVSYAVSQFSAALAMLGSTGSRAPVAAVIVGRNDDYMPDFAGRLRATLAWNTGHGVGEVVFVEWNPPSDRPLVGPALAAEFPQLRAYVVGREIHAAVCQNPSLPLLEYHAKNVGLRRAASPLVIATNADVGFAPDALRVIRRLSPSDGEVFTAQRVDIPWQDFRSTRLSLRHCLGYRRVNPYVAVGTGDFLMATRSLWHRARGYDESLRRHRIGCDIRGTAQLLTFGARVRRVGSVLHLLHPTSCTDGGVRPHHGEEATESGVPYSNGEDWGLGLLREVAIAERVWRLE